MLKVECWLFDVYLFMPFTRNIILLLLFSILGIFVLYPTGMVLYQSFLVKGSLSAGNYEKLFSNPHLFKLVWGSVALACASASCATALGLLLSIAIFKTRLRLRKLFLFAVILPMILPGFVTSLSYIFLFGRNGLITYKWLHISWNMYSWRSVLILQSLGLSTSAFFLISAVLAGIDTHLEDSARDLGASEWKVFTTVTLPLLRPGLMSAFLLAFLHSMADFGTPFIVGGRFNTLATASYTQLIGSYNAGMASALNVILLVFCLLAFTTYLKAQNSWGGVQLQIQANSRKILQFPRGIRILLGTICGLFTAIMFLLLFSILLAAFTKHLGSNFNFTLEHFRSLPQRGWNSTRNTIVFAAVTSVLVAAFGIVSAYIVSRTNFKGKQFLDLLATLPFAIPGTFMGVGYALSFNRPPLLLSGTWMIVIACTVIRELPLGLRAGVGVLGQIDRALEEVSGDLGATRIGTFFRIVLPLARPALLVSAIYACISTVKTLGAIIFLITPQNKVLSADVFEATVRGDIGAAAALSLVLMGVASAGVLAIVLLGSWRRMLPRNSSLSS